jgi:hypothetical protein
MAEGMMKKFYGTAPTCSPWACKTTMEIDGFRHRRSARRSASSSRHRSQSFDEMEEWGDDLGLST